MQLIENNYERSLRDSLDHIEKYKEHARHLKEKEDKKSNQGLQMMTKAKEEFLSKLSSLSSELHLVQPQEPESDVDRLFSDVYAQLTREYVFDEKIIVDNTVDVDPQVMQLTKEIEKLYSRKYDTVPAIKERSQKPELYQGVHLMSEISDIVKNNDNNRLKYLEDFNQLMTKTNAELTKENLDLPNLDNLFPPVQLPYVLGLMIPTNVRKSSSEYDKSPRNFATHSSDRLDHDMRNEFRNMSIHGKDIEPSLLSDYQPSPLLQVSESGKSKRINRRDIPIPDTPQDSNDSNRIIRAESDPHFVGRSSDVNAISNSVYIKATKSMTKAEIGGKII